MVENYVVSEPSTRENRLGSTISYNGTLDELEKKGCCPDSINSEKRCYNTANCCAHILAMDNLAVIKNAVLVDHGPLGCSAGMMKWNSNYKNTCKKRKQPHHNLHIISTNINEGDTIYGAVEKLRNAVVFAYDRHKPDVIFITASCATRIIGEDFESVLTELKDAIPIPIGYSACAGVRSKLWASGFDAEQHATFRTLIKPPREKRHDVVNVIDFLGGQKVLTEQALSHIGLRPQFLNLFASVEDFAHLSESLATTGLCNTLPSYLAGALEREYGVPFLKDHFANGISGFEKWYRTLAKLARKEAEGEAYIKKQREKYLPLIEEYKPRLKGKRVMIAMGPGFAFEMIRVCRELGLEVVHSNAFHYDPFLDSVDEKPVKNLWENEADVPVTIADAQHSQTVYRIRKYKPDLFITRVHGAQNPSLRLGIPTVNLAAVDLFGHAQTLLLAQILCDELENTNFHKKLAAHTNFHFSKQFEEIEYEDFVSGETI